MSNPPVKHLRSSTANKRPTASGIANGRLAINTASGTPGLYFADSASGVVKVGPAHVGASAPNTSPAGSSGNSLGELWIDNSTTIHGLNYYSGSAFVNLTPSGTTSAAGLVELATAAETQTGTDAVRVVTPSGLQSKISDSTSTTSSTTIASATAVKTAYDLANAALPKSGGRITGGLEIGPSGSLSFEGSSDDSFETTLAVVNPTADRTITFPNVTGTVITTGDSGTVTSAMIANGAIVNADINASAAIAGTKISPDFGSQNIVTTGTATAASLIPSSSGVPSNGMYLPAANSVGFSTNSTERVRIDSSGKLLVGLSSDSGSGDLFQSDVSVAAVRASTAQSNSPLVKLVRSRGDSIAASGTVIDNDLLGRVSFFGADGSAFVLGAQISAQVDGTPSANDMPGRLVFSTTADGESTPTERMRLDAAGNLLIGQSTTTTPGTTNTTTGIGYNETNSTLSISAASLDALRLNRNNDGSIVSIRRSGTQVGTISVTSTNTAYNTSSDYRLKENIVPLTGAIDRLGQLQAYRFNFIADPSAVVDGFVAHEVQEVVPECITGTKDEVDDDGNPVYQGIDQSKIVPLLTAALQEAIAEIESLKTRLDAAGI